MTPQSKSARPDHRVDSVSIPASPTPDLTRRGAGAQVSRFGATSSQQHGKQTCFDAPLASGRSRKLVHGRKWPRERDTTGRVVFAARNPSRSSARPAKPNPPVTAIPRDDERAACASPRTNPRRRQISQGGAA